MEGNGRIRLEGNDHDVSKDADVYLGPFEAAVINANPGVSLKLFHVLILKIPIYVPILFAGASRATARKYCEPVHRFE